MLPHSDLQSLTSLLDLLQADFLGPFRISASGARDSFLLHAIYRNGEKVSLYHLATRGQVCHLTNQIGPRRMLLGEKSVGKRWEGRTINLKYMEL